MVRFVLLGIFTIFGIFAICTLIEALRMLAVGLMMLCFLVLIG